MALMRLANWGLILVLGLMSAGCAVSRHHVSDPALVQANRWSGRFSLTRSGDAARAERLTVSFELVGDAHQGELVLEGPLGARVARATWAPGQVARLERNGQIETYTDLNELTQATLGQPLPMDSLFRWLDGQPASAPPWTVDLSAWPSGRISATQVVGIESLRLVVMFEAGQVQGN